MFLSAGQKFCKCPFFFSFLASILSKYLPVKGMYMNETRCFFVVDNYGSTSLFPCIISLPAYTLGMLIVLVFTCEQFYLVPHFLQLETKML